MSGRPFGRTGWEVHTLVRPEADEVVVIGSGDGGSWMSVEAIDNALDFAHLLRALRLDAGLTQEALAERSGLSIEGISALERGHRLHPRRSTIDLLARALQVDESVRRQMEERARRPAPTRASPPDSGTPASARESDRRPTDNRTDHHRLVPDQLPAPPTCLFGRAELVDHVVRAVRRGARTVVLSGMGGLGKSAVLVQAAHLLADEFTDGRIHLDMCGGQRDSALTADDALSFVLESLLADGAPVPTRRAAAVAMYRSLSAGRKLLIVLDDMPPDLPLDDLVPGGDCVLLASGRAAPPVGVDLVHAAVPVLDDRAARALLQDLVGAPRLEAEPEATASLLHSCAGLPLALKIVGARLQRRTSWPISYLAERVARQGDRLQELRIGDVAVRRCIEETLWHLETGRSDLHDAHRLFVRIGILRRRSVSVVTAAALADISLDRARAALERLTDTSLLDSTGPGQFSVHDLVHDHARALADELDGAEVAEIRRRCRRAYAALGWTAREQVRPSHPEGLAQHHAQAWPHDFDAVGSLSAIALEVDHIRELLATGLASQDEAEQRESVLLALAFTAYCVTRSMFFDWSQHLQDALRTSVGQEPVLRASLLLDLSTAQTSRGAQQESLRSAHEADRIAEELGSPRLQATAAMALSLTSGRLGAPDAYGFAVRALELARQVKDDFLEAAALRDVGLQLCRDEHLHEGLDAATRSLEIFERIGNERGRCMGLINVGVMRRRLGQREPARHLLEDAVASARACGDRELETEALDELGRWHLGAGDRDRGLELMESGLSLVDARGARQWEAGIRTRMASALAEAGMWDDAIEHWDIALQICRQRGEEGIAADLQRQRERALCGEASDHSRPLSG